jgi:hypothetical protein
LSAGQRPAFEKNWNRISKTHDKTLLMSKAKTDILDRHLQVLDDLQEMHTDAFFYTRLQARMDRGKGDPVWDFPLKPAWVLGSLMVLLAVNILWLSREDADRQQSALVTIHDFAASYDQTITTPY